MFEKTKAIYGVAKEYVKELAVYTKAEIVAGAVAGAIALGAFGHANETRRSLFQPISFSESEEVEDNAKAQNRDLNELTWFYMSINDFTAKIAEAYNWNSVWGIIPDYHRDWFSRKLEQEMDVTGRRYRRNIRDFAAILPDHGRGALRELSDLTQASQESNNLRSIFRKTWSYNREETGHMEPYEVCSTDSEGDVSCETHYRYVCDFYHHTWTYTPAEGIRASRELTLAKQRVPQIGRMQIEVPENTRAWNEQVIKQSFRKVHKREPTQAEMLQAARLYKTGSQYELNIDPAIGLWSRTINQDAQTWRSYLGTAKTAKETTGCHSAPGPVEYQFAQKIQDRFGQLIRHEQNITYGINDAIRSVPDLEHKIKVFVLRQNPPMRGHYPELKDSEIKGSPRKLSREIIGKARDLYSENIPRGNPNTSYRFSALFLYTLLGSIFGGLVGLGADALVERYVTPTRRDRWGY